MVPGLKTRSIPQGVFRPCAEGLSVAGFLPVLCPFLHCFTRLILVYSGYSCQKGEKHGPGAGVGARVC